MNQATFAERSEFYRLDAALKLDPRRRSDLGQYMTPAPIARFMTSLFEDMSGEVRLLDPGAGVGSLTAAFVERICATAAKPRSVSLTAYEIEPVLSGYLRNTLDEAVGQCRRVQIKASSELHDEDFVLGHAWGTQPDIFNRPHEDGGSFTHVLMNPPYKKINSASAHRAALRAAGLETSNLYTAFMFLAAQRLRAGGEMVAIVPRSFCNGPYFKPFREQFFGMMGLRHIHIFEKRNSAFKGDEVLQENIIIRLECGGQQGRVTVTTSTDDNFSDQTTNEHPFDRIVFPDDPERFIHVPTTTGKSTIELSPAVHYSLADIGVKVSTGPVVDFRLKAHLRDMPEGGTVPLIYPGHLRITGTVWPVQGLKKPNAILRNVETEKWLYPNGFYCVVRRFSSKEEKRRVVASVVDPAAFGDHTVLGFENHMNLFHENKRGLPELLARGLAVFLNTTAVDESFRRFNGHTQVNATDLKLMKYPSREALIELGKWAKQHDEITQDMIDEQLGKLTA